MTSGSGSRPKRRRAAAAACEVELVKVCISSSSNSILSAAVAAVNTLALSITAGEADAASEQAIRAVLPLLRVASDSGRCKLCGRISSCYMQLLSRGS